MSKINQQIQRMAERYKTNENNEELMGDLQTLILQMNEDESARKITTEAISGLLKLRMLMFGNTMEPAKSLIKTGLEDYDEKFGGLLKGEFVVLGGRPGMGKSIFIIDICIKIAEQGKVCGFLNLDMSSFTLANRFISNISKVEHSEMLKGALQYPYIFNIEKAVEKLNTLPIFVRDQFVTSTHSVLESVKKLVAENKAEVIFIDYIQLIGSFSRRNNREMELAIVCRELKKLAKELNIALVVTSQLSRQVENRPGSSKRPMLSDLRESGALEQDADKVIFLYRAEYYGLEVDEYGDPTRYMGELIVAKNRTGSCDSIKFMLEKGFTGIKKYTGPYSELNISPNRMTDFDEPAF